MVALARALATNDTPLGVLDLPPRTLPCFANRRSLPRVAESFSVRVQDDEHDCHGIDLSFGGFMCAGGEPIWPGNTTRFTLTLPGESSPIPVHGRVAELVTRHSEVAMRVRFEGITQAARKRIALWMARTRGV